MGENRSIDSVCDDFESVWRSSNAARIEEFLTAVAPDDRQSLLKGLLEIEFELLLHNGTSPDLTGYLTRFPDDGPIVADAMRVTQKRLASRVPWQQQGANRLPVDASPAADRNLLFGVQAWQSGVITEGQLLAAMQRWTFSKAQSLAQILLDTGALTLTQRELLDSMVENQIRLYQGNAGRALEAMSSAPNVANSLRQQIGDEDVRGSLDRLPVTFVPPTARMSESSAAAPHRSEPRSRYEPIKFHKGGGLGEVWRARDLELNREVALKQMKPDAAQKSALCARFVLEAEITGSLEHPGIVPVYGLGTDAKGLPFYAMRFIQGQNLSDAVKQFFKREQDGFDPRERSLEFRRLLGQFVSVCKAVQYAHDRGVLHRDLKPANIMLGKYGETLVVDWGLAKAIGRADAEPHRIFPKDETTLRPSAAEDTPDSIQGHAFGTPQFMPPEQATGRLDEIGFHSDIYSLGATLYFVLTGTYAFNDQRTTVDHQFPKPREIKATVPAELEWICLKAMATHPVDRYASSMALAQAIEDWLADEPVSAFRAIVTEFERILGESPATTVVREQLARSRANLALVLTSLGRHNESAEVFGQVIADYRSLIETDSDPRRFQAELATTRIHFSRVLLAISRDADAAEEQRLAVAEFDQLCIGSSHEHRTNLTNVLLTILPKADRRIPISEDIFLARFTKQKQIGQGAMGALYIAFDKDLGREVTIKEVPRSHYHSLERAAQTLASLNHPNILPLVGFGCRSSNAFLITPFVSGRHLDQSIGELHQVSRYDSTDPRGRYAAKEFWAELRPLLSKFALVCHAIEYAHCSGIVHRDIKPTNILLGDNGEVFVCDFEESESDDASDTEYCHFVGTVAYMSPEMAARKDVGFHSDVYSLGAVLFDLLTGQPPHSMQQSTESFSVILQEIINSPSPQVNSIAPSVPTALNRICARAMSKEISGRYQTASELGRDLETWLSTGSCDDGIQNRWIERLTSFWKR